MDSVEEYTINNFNHVYRLIRDKLDKSIKISELSDLSDDTSIIFHILYTKRIIGTVSIDINTGEILVHHHKDANLMYESYDSDDLIGNCNGLVEAVVDQIEEHYERLVEIHKGAKAVDVLLSKLNDILYNYNIEGLVTVEYNYELFDPLTGDYDN